MYWFPLTSHTRLPRPRARMTSSMRLPRVPPARYRLALATSSVS
jgi:hypothetical protein